MFRTGLGGFPRHAPFASLISFAAAHLAFGQTGANSAADAVVAPPPPADAAYEARLLSQLPPYRPAQSVSGVIRVWGHGNVKLLWMRRLITSWEEGFERFHPAVTIRYEMHGTSSAIPALYAGVGDLAVLGEEIDPAAVKAFEKVKGYPPTGIDIMTGSLDVRNFDFAQMFFVHRDNPISRLTLAQLDGIFGAEHRRGPRNLRTWGQLGLTGEWAGKPIRPYGWSYDNDFWNLYLQDAIFAGSHRWTPDLREYAHIYNRDGTIYDAGQQILDAMAGDRYGIALSNVRYVKPGMPVKALALASREGGSYVEASRRTLIDRSYPLTRIIPVVVDRQPGGRMDPRVLEFVRFILSREGQEAVVRDGRYLPLVPDAAERERLKLEAPLNAGALGSGPPSSPSGRGGVPAPEPAVLYGPARASKAIRIWGDASMAIVVKNWAEGFRRRHPDVSIEARLMGTATGMPGLYLGQADLALLGREPDTTDSDGFLHNLQYRPLQLKLTNGSLDADASAHALVVFVHRDNPLERLTLAQLDGIFGAEHRRGPRNLRTWGDLGLGGEWRTAPIHAYGYDVQTGTGSFFLHAVLGDSRKLNWDHFTEFRNQIEADGSVSAAGGRIVEALRKDRFGLAVSGLRYSAPEVKALAIGRTDAGPFLKATRESIVGQLYPLSRATYGFVDRSPGKSLDPKVAEFLSYILSGEGRDDIDREGGYIPLDAPAEKAERAKF